MPAGRSSDWALRHAPKTSAADRAGHHPPVAAGPRRRDWSVDRHRPVGPRAGTAAARPGCSRTAGRRGGARSRGVPHERPPRLDARPGVRVGGREGAPQRLVGERDAVLDVRREVGRSGRGDDVDLERHPGAQLDRRAGRDRRVDPLVEVDLVARVEEDPEERVAEMAVDDLVERAAGLADVKRLVPLDDAPRSTARRAGRRSRRMSPGSSAASSTTNPARQFSAPQIPNAVVNRSPRSIGRSPGLSSPSVARGPAVSIRWQDSGQPFQPSRATASRSVSPGRRPRAAGGRRSRSGSAAHSSAASCSTSLMTRRPSRGVDEEVGRVLDERRSRRSAPAARRRGTPALELRPVGIRLPADDADAAPAAIPSSPRISASGRDRSRGWPGRLRSWKQDAAHRQRRGAGHPPALVADEHRRVTVGPTTRIASSKRGSKPVRYDRFALCSRSAYTTRRS